MKMFSGLMVLAVIAGVGLAQNADSVVDGLPEEMEVLQPVPVEVSNADQLAQVNDQQANEEDSTRQKRQFGFGGVGLGVGVGLVGGGFGGGYGGYGGGYPYGGYGGYGGYPGYGYGGYGGYGYGGYRRPHHHHHHHGGFGYGGFYG